MQICAVAVYDLEHGIKQKEIGRFQAPFRQSSFRCAQCYTLCESDDIPWEMAVVTGVERRIDQGKERCRSILLVVALFQENKFVFALGEKHVTK